MSESTGHAVTLGRVSVRKAFGSWFFAAAVVLPLWVLVGYGVFGGSSGWTVLGLLILTPILALALLVVAFLVAFRPSLRGDRGPEPRDIIVIGAWHLSIIAFGFFPTGAWLVGLVGIVLGLASFWFSLGRLVTSSKVVLDAFTVVPGSTGPVSAGSHDAPRAAGGMYGRGAPPAPEASFDPTRPQDGQTIRLDPESH